MSGPKHLCDSAPKGKKMSLSLGDANPEPHCRRKTKHPLRDDLSTDQLCKMRGSERRPEHSNSGVCEIRNAIDYQGSTKCEQHFEEIGRARPLTHVAAISDRSQNFILARVGNKMNSKVSRRSVADSSATSGHGGLCNRDHGKRANQTKQQTED